MLDFLKNYYVFILILMVFSYLVPKEEYKAYIQFFISVFVIVLFLKPVLELLTMDNPSLVTQVFADFNAQLEQYEVDMTDGGNVFEYFFLEGEGE
ncbi:MAG: stage III sporulation protein AF [Agathobacter sp.]|nr:stage III sporulation protein AF [Agathobacter sp.]